MKESLEELMEDASLADEIVEEMANLPEHKKTQQARRLLAVAKHLQAKGDLRTQTEEQVRSR